MAQGPPGGHHWPVLYSPEKVSFALKFRHPSQQTKTSAKLTLEEDLSHTKRDLPKCAFWEGPPFPMRRVLENTISPFSYICRDVSDDG